MQKSQQALFRGRHFDPQIIVLCVRLYLRYCLTYRDLEELMAEPGGTPTRDDRRKFELRVLLEQALPERRKSRRAEEELRQSQKMEAIGYLAAGVAHDFNNLLTSIMGHASLVLGAMAEDDPGRSALESVVSGAQRAADLTRQLLAYAGKGRFYLERVDLSEVVIQTGRLIHASIPASVQLRLDLDKHLPLLLADPGQMQQVAMNLVINGAEAIGTGGGAVLVRTGRQTITHEPLERAASAG